MNFVVAREVKAAPYLVTRRTKMPSIHVLSPYVTTTKSKVSLLLSKNRKMKNLTDVQWNVVSFALLPTKIK